MEERHLRSVEIGNLALGGVAIGLAAVFASPSMLEGVLGGVGLAILNFHVVRRLVRAFALRGSDGRGSGGRGSLAPLVFALVAKLAAMMVAVWAVVRFTRWDVVGFALGLSIFIVSIFAVSFRYIAVARAEAESAT